MFGSADAKSYQVLFFIHSLIFLTDDMMKADSETTKFHKIQHKLSTRIYTIYSLCHATFLFLIYVPLPIFNCMSKHLLVYGTTECSICSEMHYKIFKWRQIDYLIFLILSISEMILIICLLSMH